MANKGGRRECQSFDGPRRMLTIRMSPEEYERVRLAAKLERASMESFCRREILAAAIFVVDGPTLSGSLSQHSVPLTRRNLA